MTIYIFVSYDTNTVSHANFIDNLKIAMINSILNNRNEHFCHNGAALLSRCALL